MKLAFYLNCVSTHQLPLAKEVAKLVDEFAYVYEGESDQAYQRVSADGLPFKVVCRGDRENGISGAEEILLSADSVVSGLRDLDLFERRAAKGLKTFYTSERWFKPIPLRGVKVEGWRLRVGEWDLPGCVRMLIPSYRRMVKRFVRWANSDPDAKVLAIGPWAKQDFLRMGVRAEKIVDWGYFVAPSKLVIGDSCSCRMDALPLQLRTTTLKVLWVGRDIPLKHVGDIEKAVRLVNNKLLGVVSVEGSIVGTRSLRCEFTKLTGVTPEEVRRQMREHDVFVFASDGFEGWGAVVSEALEEGMNVIGTWECGAPPTLLPKERLYHCGDVKALARLLELEVEGLRLRGEGKEPILPSCSIGDWTAKRAAQRLVELV